MPTYPLQLSLTVREWMQRLEPFGWILSLLCFLVIGMIDIPLPEAVLTTLLIGIGSGPILHLAQRTARTALLILAILMIESLLYLGSEALSPVWHAALFHALFGMVLWSLGYAFVARANHSSWTLTMAGVHWAFSGAALLTASILAVTSLTSLFTEAPSFMLVRLPLVDLLIGLGASISSFGLP